MAFRWSTVSFSSAAHDSREDRIFRLIQTLNFEASNDRSGTEEEQPSQGSPSGGRRSKYYADERGNLIPLGKRVLPVGVSKRVKKGLTEFFIPAPSKKPIDKVGLTWAISTMGHPSSCSESIETGGRVTCVGS